MTATARRELQGGGGAAARSGAFDGSWPSSRSVEAACKTLVAQRMKQSGMRWGVDGGRAILTARGWCHSDRFDKAWALIAATYKLQVTPLDTVVPLRRPSRPS